jgi:tetratricopeptide (TPR) repeat protein
LRLRDALSRFDEVRVLAGSPVALTELGTLPLTPADLMSRSDFALGATIEWGDEGGAAVSFRLADVADGTLLWSRRFERTGSHAADSFVEAMVRQVATSVAQPYGVVQARQRARALQSEEPPERFVCVLEAFEYWRSFEPVRHYESRKCLEQAVARDRTFVLGFATLAAIYLEEYRTGLNSRPGEPLARDRALAVAREALELAPESARVHQALLDVHFVRGEIEPALSHGTRAIELNPYDTDILADFGARLIASGDLQRGTAFLERATAFNVATPAWVDFFMFLSAHLRGSTEKAHYHAGLITTDTYPLGLIARIIAAADRADTERARAEVARLARLQPDWISDPRSALERFFPDGRIVARLLSDLDRAGLSAGGR